MKLVESRNSASFYESFSDLIFCTLCLFILIVAGLALRLQHAQKNLLHPNRFQRGAATSYMFTSLVRIPKRGANGRVTSEEFVVWAPVNQKSDLETTGTIERGQESLLRDHTGGKVLILPLAEATKISSGIGKKVEHVTPSAYTSSIQMYFDARQRISDQLKPLTDKSDFASMRKLLYSKPALNRWLSRTRWNWDTIADRCVRVVLNPLKAESAHGTFVRFSLVSGSAAPPTDADRKKEFERNERVFRVGKVDLTTDQFDALLRSIMPGKGFYVEYLDKDGDIADPPKWVIDVLEETGYDARMLRKQKPAFRKTTPTP